MEQPRHAVVRRRARPAAAGELPDGRAWRRAVRERGHEALLPAARGLAPLYVFLALTSFLLSTETTSRAVNTSLAGFTAAYFTVLAVLLGRRTSPLRLVHPVAGFSALLVLLNATVGLLLARDPDAVVFVDLTVAGTGILVFSGAWLAFLTTSASAGVLTAVVLHPELDWTRAVIGFVCSLVLAGIVHRTQLRSLARVHAAAVELGRVAVTDELTGLHNRRGFFRSGAGALAQASRRGLPAVLLFADVDGMKRVNDEHGHEAGDALVREAATLLRGVAGEDALVARLGGDELVAPLVGVDDPAGVVARFQQEAEARAERSDRPWRLSVSAGAALARAGDPPDLDALLRAADAAMYAAKSLRRAPGSPAPG